MSDPEPKPVHVEVHKHDDGSVRVVMSTGRTRSEMMMVPNGYTTVQSVRDSGTEEAVTQYRLPIATPEREPE